MLKPIKTVLKFNPCFCWHKKISCDISYLSLPFQTYNCMLYIFILYSAHRSEIYCNWKEKNTHLIKHCVHILWPPKHNQDFMLWWDPAECKRSSVLWVFLQRDTSHHIYKTWGPVTLSCSSGEVFEHNMFSKPSCWCSVCTEIIP